MGHNSVTKSSTADIVSAWLRDITPGSPGYQMLTHAVARIEYLERENDRLREDRDNYKTAANREFGYRKELERQLRELDLSYKESEQDSTLAVKEQKCVCGRPLFDGHSHDELAYGKEKL